MNPNYYSSTNPPHNTPSTLPAGQATYLPQYLQTQYQQQQYQQQQQQHQQPQQYQTQEYQTQEYQTQQYQTQEYQTQEYQTQQYQPPAPYQYSQQNAYQQSADDAHYTPSAAHTYPAVSRPSSSRARWNSRISPEEVAEQCSKIVNQLRAEGECVLFAVVLSRLNEHFHVKDFRETNVNWNMVPLLDRLKGRENEVNAFIVTHVNTRAITTLYDLQQEIATYYGKEIYEEIGLGSLLKHPTVCRFFQPAATLTEVPKISTMEIVTHLLRYRQKNGQKSTQLPAFMEYLVEEKEVKNPYELCVSIRGLGLYIKMIGHNTKIEKERLEEQRRGLIGVAEREFLDQNSSQKLVQINSAKLKFQHEFDRFIQDLRSRKHLNDCQNTAEDIFSRLPVQRGCLKQSYVVRVLCQIAAIYAHFVRSTKEVVVQTKDVIDITGDLSEKKEASVDQKRPDYEIESSLMELLETLDGIDVISLGKLERDLVAEFDVPHFSSLGHGSFMDFVSMKQKILTRIKAKEQSASKSVPLSDVLNFTEQCLVACGCDNITAVRDDAHQKQLELTISRRLCSHFDVKKVTDLDKGDVKKILELLKKRPTSQRLNTVVWSDALTCELVDIEDAKQDDEQAENPSVGRWGTVTDSDVLQTLRNTPFLCDIVKWTQWSELFASQFGSIVDFLKTRDHNIFLMATRDQGLIRLDPGFSVSKLLTVATSGNPYLTAVGLTSIVASHRSVSSSPLSLLKTHLHTAVAQLYAEDQSQALEFMMRCICLIPSDGKLRQELCDKIIFPALRQAEVNDFPTKFLDLCQIEEDFDVFYALGVSLGISEWSDAFKARAMEEHISEEALAEQEDQIMRSEYDEPQSDTSGTKSPQKEVLEKAQQKPKKRKLESMEENDTQGTQKKRRSELTKEKGSKSTNVDVADEKEGSCKDILSDIMFKQFGVGLNLEGAAAEIFKIQNERMGRALEGLSRELYSDEAHFVLELVQNADDNSYSPEVRPTVAFTLSKDTVTVENNEIGFNERNVRALCDIAASTKSKTDSGYIGQKGIGFKSVFRVTDAPEIHSNGFHLRFDATKNKMGYIRPSWISPEERVTRDANDPKHDWETLISLPLTEGQRDRLDSLRAKFGDISPNILLFLHRLKRMEIYDYTSQSLRTMTLTTEGSNVVSISHCCEYLKPPQETDENMDVDEKIEEKNSQERFLVVKEVFKPKVVRDGVGATEMSLAFPLYDKNQQKNLRRNILPQQKVFGFLPLRTYGLKFMLNADWILPSSRECVDESSSWNEWLRSEVSGLFVRTLETWKKQMKKKDDCSHINQFFQCCPLEGEVFGFFRSVAREVRNKLKHTPCLLSQDLEWVMPHQVLFPPSDEVTLSLVSEDLVRSRLGIHFLHKNVALSPPLRDALGLKQFGIKHLIQLMESVCNSPQGIGQVDSDWASKWLVALYQCLKNSETAPHRNVSVHRLHLGPRLEATLLEQLKSFSFIRLSNGIVTSVREGPTFFPIPSWDDGQLSGLEKALQKFSSELRILDPKFVNVGDEVATSMLSYMLEQLGIRHVTPHDLVHLHILPTLEEQTCINKPVNVLQHYLIFLKLHQDQCIRCRTPKMMETLSKLLIVLTSQGPKRATTNIHFPPILGNKLHLSSLVTNGLPWSFVGDCYFQSDGSTGTVQSWREFFLNFGVSDFVLVHRKDVEISDIDSSASPWTNAGLAQTWKKPVKNPGSVVISDASCAEFTKLASSFSSHELRTQFMKVVMEAFDSLWDDNYEQFAKAVYKYPNHRRIQGETLSSFVLNLKATKWLPASDSKSNELCLPSDLVLRSDRIYRLFENHVKYLDGSLRSPKFIAHLGIECEATLRPSFVLEMLKQWSKDLHFSASKSQIKAIYSYLSEQPRHKSEEIIQAFKEHNLLYIPFKLQASVGSLGKCLGKFYSLDEVVMFDETKVMDNFGMRVLMTNDDIKEFRDFFKLIGVKEYPSFDDYLALLKAMCTKNSVNQVSEQTFDIFAYWGEKIVKKQVKDDEIESWRKKLKPEYVLPPHNCSIWTALTDLPLINDDSDLAKKFNQFSALRLISIPKHSKNKQYIEAFLVDCLKIEKLSKQVVSEAVTEMLSSGSIVESIIRYNVANVQRWIYHNHNELYKTLTANAIAAKLLNMNILIATKLFVKFVLRDFHSAPTPTKCVLHQTEKSATLTIRLSDVKDYGSIYVELSRLFFSVTNPDVANFLHVLTELQRNAEDPDDCKRVTENYMSGIQKIPALPVQERIWRMSDQIHSFVPMVDAAAHETPATEDALLSGPGYVRRPYKPRNPNISYSWPPRGFKPRHPPIPVTPTGPQSTTASGVTPAVHAPPQNAIQFKEPALLQPTRKRPRHNLKRPRGTDSSSSSSQPSSSSSAGSSQPTVPNPSSDVPLSSSATTSPPASGLPPSGSTPTSSTPSPVMGAPNQSEATINLKPNAPAVTAVGTEANRQTSSTSVVSSASSGPDISIMQVEELQEKKSEERPQHQRRPFRKLPPAQVPKGAIVDLDFSSIKPPRQFEPPKKTTVSEEQLEEIGRWGEEMVYILLQREMQTHLQKGQKCEVNWVNQVEETGLSYDIEFIVNGVVTYIEVKTTITSNKDMFNISASELELAREKGDKFHIYRVYNAMSKNAKVLRVVDIFDLIRKNIVNVRCYANQNQNKNTIS